MFTSQQVFVLERLIAGDDYYTIAKEMGLSSTTVLVALRSWVEVRYNSIHLDNGIIRMSFEAARDGLIDRLSLPRIARSDVLGDNGALEVYGRFLTEGLKADNRLKVIETYTSIGLSNCYQLAALLGFALHKARRHVGNARKSEA